MGRVTPNKNQKPATYLAPVYRTVIEGLVNTTPGVSSQMNWSPLPGCKCTWFQQGLPVEIVNENTFQGWERKMVAKVPPGVIAPDVNTATLVMKIKPAIIFIMADETSPKEWERIEIAFAPLDYWETYGEYYTNDNTAMYYSEDYRVKIDIKDGSLKVPPTWIAVEGGE